MAYTTIDNPELYFQTELWTGDQSENARTLDGSEDMQPDFVWVKGRSFADTGGIFDSVRGATKLLIPSTEAAESTVAQSLKSFDSDGFTMGTESALNKTSSTMIAWCWKESATAGFDILSYSGTGSARTQAHSLSAKPNWIIVKKTSAAGGSWFVYLTGGIPATNYVKLNEAGATSASSTMWNNTEPTSSVFSLGTSSDVNGDGVTYVAYLWRSVQGFSKFGQYEGSGSTTDNTFVYLGFKPAMIIVKAVDTANQWNMFDNKRNTANPMDTRLFADATDAETTYASFDFLAQGFKVRNTSVGIGTADTFIYMAFAESPLVNSSGVPNNAR